MTPTILAVSLVRDPRLGATITSCPISSSNSRAVTTLMTASRAVRIGPGPVLSDAMRPDVNVTWSSRLEKYLK